MNTYSEKISSEQAKEIKKLFEIKGAVFDTVQYSVWRAKTSNFQAIYYESGKLLVQGKDVNDITNEINKILGINNIISPDETGIIPKEEKYIGTDESGKGDFFGPLIIAGVQVDSSNKQKFIELGIKDSKKLQDKVILSLASKIKANSVHSVIIINPVKYNELYSRFRNLNKLLAWGHARAIENILDKSSCNYALADKFGDESLIKNALMKKGQSINLKQMVRAESDIAVAAASVLARAEFVKKMDELSRRYELNFSKGASSKVIEEAKEFVKTYSPERLNEIAKLHFKTIEEVLK